MRQLIEPAGGTICITPYCVKPKLTLHGPSYDGRSNYAVAGEAAVIRVPPSRRVQR